MKIALTFDNGPDADVTPEVLDTLRRHEVLATFFVVGEKLRHGRAPAQRAHAEGHWIGNHTYNHLVPLGQCGEAGQAAAEITRTQELIGDLAHPRRLFRPMGGGGGGGLDDTLLNAEAVRTLVDGAYTCVTWNAVPRDWVRPSGWPEPALELCRAQEHALLVLHDLPTGAMDQLDRFIGLARDAGAEFVQEPPDRCVLMERGVPRDGLARIAAAVPSPETHRSR